ncbi:MAG: hypothetical protein NTY19_19580 [Planctomycetota bacterium]|nr:hypothetical protein [Planctomycetota bacterium]
MLQQEIRRSASEVLASRAVEVGARLGVKREKNAVLVARTPRLKAVMKGDVAEVEELLDHADW